MFVDTQVRPQGEQVDAVAPAKMKLSAVVRECGYGAPYSYHHCVLGRAYRRLTGRDLFDDAGNEGDHRYRPWVSQAAEAFGIPFDAAQEAERMCLSGRPPEAIASWLESQGL